MPKSLRLMGVPWYIGKLGVSVGAVVAAAVSDVCPLDVSGRYSELGVPDGSAARAVGAARAVSEISAGAAVGVAVGSAVF